MPDTIVSTTSEKKKNKTPARQEFERVFRELHDAKLQYTHDWDSIDEQVRAEPKEKTDDQGNPTGRAAAVNLPMENQFIQAQVSEETANPPIYDLVPEDNDRAENKIQVLKALDDHHEYLDDFHSKLVRHIYQKCKYGWSVMFDGYYETKQKHTVYNVKGEEETREEVVKNFISRVVDPRNFYVDNVDDIDRAEHAIEIEKISIEEFHRRYKGHKLYDQKVVNQTTAKIQRETPLDGGSRKSDDSGRKTVKIEHFYRKADKDGGRYAVWANGELIRDGKNWHPLGWLPYSMQSNLPDESSILGGRGVPSLLSQHKLAANKLFDAYLVHSHSAAKPKIVVGENTVVKNPADAARDSLFLQLSQGSATDLTSISTAAPHSSALNSLTLIYQDATKLIGYDPEGLSQENPSESATKVLARAESRRLRVALYDKEFTKFFKRMKRMRLANLMTFYPMPLQDSEGKYLTDLKTGRLKYPSMMVKGEVVIQKKGEDGTPLEAEVKESDKYSLLEVSPAVVRANVVVKVRNGSNRPVFKTLETEVFNDNLEKARVLFVDLQTAKQSKDEAAIAFAQSNIKEFSKVTDYPIPDFSSEDEPSTPVEMAQKAKEQFKAARVRPVIPDSGAVPGGGEETTPEQTLSAEAAAGGEAPQRPESGAGF